MMKKIKNPFVEVKEYNCFACSPKNELGLQMEFIEDGDEVICNWKPKDHLTGYANVIHGGIQTTLLDEIASWTIFIKLKTAGMTVSLNVDFKRPVLSDRGKIKVTGKVNNVENGKAEIITKIIDSAGHTCTEGKIYYRLFSEEKAKKKLYYPGFDNFF
ncbi:MAG: PaaI family thioesterase [Melioribacteraceae bacterium]|nr:PaaI family thioesterase [Melioribacteraceae bacterium]MCF8354046.1 PaaI family thioesterase [Melioribacteraceae bacterium]MCF8392273.1 PaaI family thioesterase [Melioribacteraceae bacterium]MCF8417605.1 PaaI family thioesterase [Melioribacteraceae bacterium]